MGTASSEQRSRSVKYGSRANRSSRVASATTSGSPRALDVAQHRHRHRGLPGRRRDRGRLPAGRGQQPVAAVVAPQQQVHAGGAGHRAEHLDHAGVQPLDAGLRAQRLGGGQDAEQVDRPGRDRRVARGGRRRSSRPIRPQVGRRSGRPSRAGRPSRSRPRRRTASAGLGEQVVAGVFDAVGEVEAGRAFGDQGPVPRPPAGRRPRAARRRRRGRRRGSRRPPRPARPRAAAAGAGSSPARPRRGRPATASPRPARPAARRARHRRRRGTCPARASPRSRRATAVG